MKKALTLTLILALAACGGGSGSSSDNSTNNGATGSSGGSGGSGSGGGNGGSGGSGGVNALLKVTQYQIYKFGSQSILSGAGAITNQTATGGTLSLAGDGNTVLSITDPNQGSMSASNYTIVNRSNGGIIMLCDTASFSKGRYVGIASKTSDTSITIQPIANVSALAGQTLYHMEDCSYVDTNNNPQNQTTAGNGQTDAAVFDTQGNVTFNDGQPAITAANFNPYLSGTAIQPSGATGPTIYLAAYKVNNRYVLVEQGIAPAGSGKPGYVAMWMTN